jgi:hypothetical protein
MQGLEAREGLISEIGFSGEWDIRGMMKERVKPCCIMWNIYYYIMRNILCLRLLICLVPLNLIDKLSSKHLYTVGSIYIKEHFKSSENALIIIPSYSFQKQMS